MSVARRTLRDLSRPTAVSYGWETLKRHLAQAWGKVQRLNVVGGAGNNDSSVPPYSIAAIALLDRKFKSLGVDVQDLNLLAPIAKDGGRVAAGADIIRAGDKPRHSTVLLEGVACLYKRLADGTRQIYAFKYPGDFCDLLPEPDDAVAVQAVSECSLAAFDHNEIEQVIARSNTLRLALWRSTMLDTFIFRERIASPPAAMPRVAHLLCEQLARREAIGMKSTVLPFTQIDLADAAGLSVVHVNRTVQALRKLNVLSSANSAIEVVDKKQLASIGRFDGHYLNMPRLMSHWTLNVVH